MSPPPFQITRCRPGEEPLLWRLFHDTTHFINGRDYTEAQCCRWAPVDKDLDEWAGRIREKNPFVARHGPDEPIVGFAELEPDGHIDYFYVHHQWQRKGVGRALYHALEGEARRLALPVLTLESSVTAMPFFASMGFEITAAQENVICDAPAKRFIMLKALVNESRSARQES